MKTVISVSGKKSALPKGVVGISYWQSASSDLDYGLVELCEKAGCIVTFIEVARNGYDGVIVSTKVLSKRDISYIEDNWEDLPKQVDR